MSRAFIREDAAPEEEPSRPRSTRPNYVTARGLERLRARAAELEEERARLKPEVSDPAAAQRLARVERDLVYYQERADSAILVRSEGRPSDRVYFGATVEYRGPEGPVRVRIVGEDEEDSRRGDLSWTSPLAEALLGAKPGEKVSWRRPAGDVELEVLSVRYD